MLKRIITGVLLIAIVAVFLVLRSFNKIYFEIFVAVLIFGGTLEMVRALGAKFVISQKITAVIFSLLLAPAFHFGIAWFFALIVGQLIVQIFLMVIDSRVGLDSLCLTQFIVFYPAILLISLLLLNNLPENSLRAIVMVFIIGPMSDTFAFLVGSTLKGRKLCPNISPKKTVSGAVGGLVGGAAAGFLLAVLLPTQMYYNLAVNKILLFTLLGAVGSFFTQLGDLSESVIKRKAGVKDMGAVLPGHGGILDRIDGIMFAGFFFYLVFRFVLLL